MEPDLMTEVGRFRRWAEGLMADPEQVRSGEWECEYEDWSSLREAVLHFLRTRPVDTWVDDESRAVLYAIARDNEDEYLAHEIRERHPYLVLLLARRSLAAGERDDRWQLADQLGRMKQLRGSPEVEELLLEFAADEYEYVRRRALRSLLRMGSIVTEEVALRQWDVPGEAQPWSRMMVLSCLQELGSSHLAARLAQAERDENEHLREYAKRIRRGEVSEL